MKKYKGLSTFNRHNSVVWQSSSSHSLEVFYNHVIFTRCWVFRWPSVTGKYIPWFGPLKKQMQQQSIHFLSRQQLLNCNTVKKIPVMFETKRSTPGEIPIVIIILVTIIAPKDWNSSFYSETDKTWRNYSWSVWSASYKCLNTENPLRSVLRRPVCC